MSAVEFRTHRPGDIGYIIYRHAVLYAEAYGWGHKFELYVTRIMGDFLENYDPVREQCWIAERDGQFLGCVLVCKDKSSENTARLRVLLVEKDARGLGLGKQLSNKCVDFAREAGYEKILLSTQSDIDAARGLYKGMGFSLVRMEEAGDFAVSPDSHGEIWEMVL